MQPVVIRAAEPHRAPLMSLKREAGIFQRFLRRIVDVERVCRDAFQPEIPESVREKKRQSLFAVPASSIGDPRDPHADRAVPVCPVDVLQRDVADELLRRHIAESPRNGRPAGAFLRMCNRTEVDEPHTAFLGIIQDV